MLNLLITLLLLLFIARNPKKGIVFTAMVIQPLTYIGSGIGTISMYYILSAFSLIIVFLSPIKKNLSTYPKSLFLTSFLMALSFLLTTIFNDWYHVEIVMANLLTQLIFPILYWCVLDDTITIKYSIKCLSTISWVAIVVVIPELLLSHNYITDIINKIFITTDFVIDSEGMRYGVKRTNSIFSYFSTFGVFCCLSSFIVWVLVTKLKYEKKKYVYLMFLLPFCAFTTGSRAIFLALFCILLGLFTSKRIIKTNVFKLFIVTCIVLSPYVVDYLFTIVDSIINSSGTSSVEGSNSDLRMMQWNICLPYFSQSPIWGNGRLFIWEYVAYNNPMLLGAESLWFSLLVDYGLMGALTYILMIAACCIVLYKYNSRLIWMPIGYFLILSLSPDSGIEYNQLLTFVVLSIRILQSYERSVVRDAVH